MDSEKLKSEIIEIVKASGEALTPGFLFLAYPDVPQVSVRIAIAELCEAGLLEPFEGGVRLAAVSPAPREDYLEAESAAETDEPGTSSPEMEDGSIQLGDGEDLLEPQPGAPEAEDVSSEHRVSDSDMEERQDPAIEEAVAEDPHGVPLAPSDEAGPIEGPVAAPAEEAPSEPDDEDDGPVKGILRSDSVKRLNLPARSVRVLNNASVKRIHELVSRLDTISEEDNCGFKSVKEMWDALGFRAGEISIALRPSQTRALCSISGSEKFVFDAHGVLCRAPKPQIAEGGSERIPSEYDYGQVSIHDLDLDKVIANAFERRGIKTVGDVLATDREQLLKLPGVSAMRVAALIYAVDKLLEGERRVPSWDEASQPADGILETLLALYSQEAQSVLEQARGLCESAGYPVHGESFAACYIDRAQCCLDRCGGDCTAAATLLFQEIEGSEDLRRAYALQREREISQARGEDGEESTETSPVSEAGSFMEGAARKATVNDEDHVSKPEPPDSIPRPSDSVVEGFLAKVRATPEELVAMADAPELVEFDSDVVGNEKYGQREAFDMLRRGDFLEVYVEDGLVHLGFCGHDLGLINKKDRINYDLSTIVGDAEAYGLVRGRVFARVEGVAGGKKRPKAILRVFYVTDMSRRKVVNGILLSQDGKTAIKQMDDSLTALVVPEGVEEIAPHAFEGRPISDLQLPSTLKTIGDGAFARTRVARVRIPASVESIGAEAFSRGQLNGGVGSSGKQHSYWRIEGPTFIDVDEANPRYGSINGSLYERTGTGKRLLSLYRESSVGNRPTIKIPEGITSLAANSIIEIGHEWDINLRLPTSLVSMEYGCLDGLHIARISIPASTCAIDDDCWRQIFLDADEIDLVHGMSFDEEYIKIKIDPVNPRYYVKGRKVYERVEANEAESSADVDEPANDESIEECRFAYVEEGGKGFEYSFKLPKDEDDNRWKPDSYIGLL